jgi:hypothetical protein
VQVAEIDVRLREPRVEPRSLAVARHRGFQVPRALEQDPEVVACPGVPGPDTQQAPVTIGGQLEIATGGELLAAFVEALRLLARG